MKLAAQECEARLRAIIEKANVPETEKLDAMEALAVLRERADVAALPKITVSPGSDSPVTWWPPQQPFKIDSATNEGPQPPSIEVWNRNINPRTCDGVAFTL